MIRYLVNPSRLLSMILIVTCLSCDDEPLESSQVTFSGNVTNADFSPAANVDIEILVRTNPFNDPDTTIRVRIPLTTDETGSYTTTIHTDDFPAIPFYTVAPVADTLVSLEIGQCSSQPVYHQVFITQDNIMSTRFGAASFVRVTFHKTIDSNATSARFTMCNTIVSTSLVQPDVTATMKLPYETTPSQFTLFYVVFIGDFFAETRSAEVFLEPYKTTDVVIDY